MLQLYKATVLLYLRRIRGSMVGASATRTYTWRCPMPTAYLALGSPKQRTNAWNEIPSCFVSRSQMLTNTPCAVVLRVGNNRLIYLTFFSVSTGYPHRPRITQYYGTCISGVVHRRNINGAMENVTGLRNYPEGRGVRALEGRVSCALLGDCPLKVRRAATPYQCTKQILVFALFWFDFLFVRTDEYTNCPAPLLLFILRVR